ncbi:hypothetical protein SAMN05216480_11639 [Pustulibacterium marinum]|uniref:VWA domain-containing protein n=1 Tax=Pustulibacterium marinum TaxID=1224947 RepID=A0A1I7IH41_9FLAO|nr:vWA domain-containing protein [Pustulibacterium marinum]SFU72215.1 hypothetical protein SAMN05216480_11639 [Pustulibacterium marinum]
MNSITIIYLILALVAAAAIAFFYYKKQSQSNSLRWIFTVLRFLVLFLVLILLINPKIKHTSYTVEKPKLAVLLDNSSSLVTLEDSIKMKSQILEFIQNPDLRDKFDIEPYLFDEKLTAGDSLSFKGNTTDISKALRGLDKIHSNKTAPIVLFSDGNQTYGSDYTYAAQTIAQPVYTVVVGDTTNYEDLKVSTINVNKYAFYENEFPVEIFLNYQGTENRTANFKISNGNSIVFQKEVAFSGQQLSQKLNFTLKAKSIGVQQYKAEISILDNEKNTANNTKQFAVEVLDERTKVAIISDIVHPDLGALKKSIESNQQRSVSILKPSEVKDLNDYQLVILYQPTTSFQKVFSTLDQLDKNYFLITGSKTDWNFINSNQSIIQKDATTTEEIQGIYDSNFSSFLINEIPFSDFPPLTGYLGAARFNGESDVLLQQRVRNITLEDPLLATVEKNNRRFAYLFGENSWQWRAKSYLEAGDFIDYDEFIGKLVFYLASNKKKERLQVNAETFYYGNVLIDAAYFDKNYQFDPNAEVSIQLENTETKEKERFDMLLKNSYFEFNTNTLTPGVYNFNIHVKGENISKSGSVTLIGYNVEAQFYNADYKKMSKLSEVTQGEVTLLNNLKELKESLTNNTAYKPIQKAKETISPVISWELLLFVITALLAIEWFLRKYNGLI